MLDALVAADAALQRWLVSWPHHPVADLAMLAVSGLGWQGIVWMLLAAVAAARWRGQAAMAAWRVLLAVMLAVSLTDGVLKPLFDRNRPFVADTTARVIGVRSSRQSFPSGHAAAAVAGAYALGLLWPSRRRAWWTLAVVICVSRLYLGVHYPLDVLGGALVGWACASFVTAGAATRGVPGRRDSLRPPALDA
jgi:undecaprenyl-diphosphatase